MHLRIYSPAHLTQEATRILATSSGVSSLAVMNGASVLPPGDLVMADIPREGANDVLNALRALGIPETGAIQIDHVPTWISRHALEAEQKASAADADTVVWAEVTQRAYNDSRLTWTFLVFMVLATLIASIGIVLDSQILIIGAMILGPEFGAVAAMGLALVRRRPHLLRAAIRTLLVGFVGAIVVTAAITVVGRLLGWVTAESITGARPLTRFIRGGLVGRHLRDGLRAEQPAFPGEDLRELEHVARS